jgi:hypothetical protein
MNAERFSLALLLAIVLLIVVVAVGGSSAGDVAISGKLRYNALLQVGDDTPVPYEVSTQRYIVEAPPSTVGEVVRFDSGIVDSLCRDREGCQVSLQMEGADPAKPGQVVSRTTWLFLSEISDWFRYGAAGSSSLFNPYGDVEEIEGEDDLGAQYLTTAGEWWLGDCILTQAETVLESGDNLRGDNFVGFGLLNCENSIAPEHCMFDDAATLCRVEFKD